MYRRRKLEDEINPPPEMKTEDFDPNKKMDQKELALWATLFLKEDRRDSESQHDIYLPDQLNKAYGREYCVDATQIDGTLTDLMQDPNKPGVHKGDNQRIFWRQLPNGGRKVNTKEQRQAGSSYFKG